MAMLHTEAMPDEQDKRRAAVRTAIGLAVAAVLVYGTFILMTALGR